MLEALLLRTRSKNSCKLAVKAAGVHYWRSVEVPGESFFMVERSEYVTADKLEVRRHIATDIYDALELVHEGRSARAKLLAYLRAPATFAAGYHLQVVSEVHRVDAQESTFLLRFESGLLVAMRDGQIDARAPIGICHRIYPWEPPPS